MPFEIDFLPVGDKSKSGDAIALRYGPELAPGKQTVIVVDGGTKDSGTSLVNHIKKYYQQDVVDHVVLTHPHDDHASGLTVILEQLDVKNLWMHTPWESSKQILNFITDARATKNGLENRLARSLSTAKDIYDLAKAKNIPIHEPYSGMKITDNIYIIGPDKIYYNQQAAIFAEYGTKTEAGSGILAEFLKAALKLIKETWSEESLIDPSLDDQDAINDSSAILLVSIDNQYILLPGDAGPFALEKAIIHSETIGHLVKRPYLFKLPHHGSKRNVGPSILNKILGEITTDSNVAADKYSLASVAKEGRPKHPSQKVINACRRRGYDTHQTCGRSIYFSRPKTDREGWQTAAAIGFQEEYDDEE